MEAQTANVGGLGYRLPLFSGDLSDFVSRLGRIISPYFCVDGGVTKASSNGGVEGSGVAHQRIVQIEED